MNKAGWTLCRHEIMLHMQYNEAVALDIIHQTKESFYDLFGKLKNEIEENWL